MSDFVRRALRDLSGNHFKLWACLLEYRQSLTLEQFAEAASLDLATVKRLLKPDPDGKPGLLGDTYISVQRDQRPHRYSLASQLQLRFEEAPLKVAKYDFQTGSKVANDNSKVAFCDSLYLDSSEQMNLSDTKNQIDSHESRKTQLSRRKWRPDNEAEWRARNEFLAQDTAQMVGDREGSLRWHIHLWAHVRYVDAVYNTRLEPEVKRIATDLMAARKDGNGPQGATFNARCNKLLTRAGYPIGRKEKPDDFENVAVQPELSLSGDPAASAPNSAPGGSDADGERRNAVAG